MLFVWLYFVCFLGEGVRFFVCAVALVCCCLLLCVCYVFRVVRVCFILLMLLVGRVFSGLSECCVFVCLCVRLLLELCFWVLFLCVRVCCASLIVIVLLLCLLCLLVFPRCAVCAFVA